jgi:hypothetical protein
VGSLAQEVPTGPSFDKVGFEELMKRRFFFAPAFEIYGGEKRRRPVAAMRLPTHNIGVRQAWAGSTTTAPRAARS